MAGTASTDIHSTITDEHGHPHTAKPRGRYLALLSLTALGIVYGDIGTSPLYAMRECFHGPHAIAVTPDNIFGVLSLIFWSLIIIISIKYAFRPRAAIVAKRHSGFNRAGDAIKIVSKRKAGARCVGIFGARFSTATASTPSPSRRIEGLNVATPFFRFLRVPITIVIIVGFSIQSHGTRSGACFGPSCS